MVFCFRESGNKIYNAPVKTRDLSRLKNIVINGTKFPPSRELREYGKLKGNKK